MHVRVDIFILKTGVTYKTRVDAKSTVRAELESSSKIILPLASISCYVKKKSAKLALQGQLFNKPFYDPTCLKISVPSLYLGPE